MRRQNYDSKKTLSVIIVTQQEKLVYK